MFNKTLKNKENTSNPEKKIWPLNYLKQNQINLPPSISGIKIIAYAVSILLHCLILIELPNTPHKTDLVEIEYLPEKSNKNKPSIETENLKVNLDDQKHSLSYFKAQTQQYFKKQTQAQNIGQLKNHNQHGRKVSKNKFDSGNFFIPSPIENLQSPSESSSPFDNPLIEKGSVNFINTDYSSYATFMNRIQKTIFYNYSKNLEDMILFPHIKEKLLSKPEWSTLIELTLNAEGHYKNAIVVRSSGLVEFDANSLQTLKDSLPFLNPPHGLIEENGSLRFTASFNIYTRPRKWSR